MKTWASDNPALVQIVVVAEWGTSEVGRSTCEKIVVNKINKK